MLAAAWASNGGSMTEQPQPSRADPFMLLADHMVAAHKIAKAVEAQLAHLPAREAFAEFSAKMGEANDAFEAYLEAAAATFAEPIKEAVKEAAAGPQPTALFIPRSWTQQ